MSATTRTVRHLQRALLAAALLGAAPRPSAAQPPAPAVPDAAAADLARTQFLADFARLHRKLMDLAGVVPEDRFGWRPAPGARSVAEVYQHLLSDHYRGVAVGFGVARARVDSGPEAFRGLAAPPSRGEALRHLEQVGRFVTSQIAALRPEQLAGTLSIYGQPRTVLWTAVNMTGETHEHLGQLIAYARMMGLVPPWSQ
jgi:hypothetical protein